MELQQVLILLASSQCRAHDFEARGRREGGARSPYHSSGRHLLVQHLYTLQGPCTGARVEGSGCRLGGCKGCTWRCLARAHTHTHSRTLPAKEERAGDLPSTRADIHCARWHIHSDSVQKGPKYFMHFLCIATCTYMQPLQPYCIYCICDILFIASIYIAYCLYVTYILYIAYSPYIA